MAESPSDSKAKVISPNESPAARTAGLIQKIQSNRLFKFTSSVRLAVPLMLVLIVCIAAGTVIESNYNSDYAKLVVYNTWWFLGLLALLFLNILNATLSRWPFKFHHVGFVTTHIGLLTLLIGAFITAFFGVDGILRVREGSSNSTVILPRLMIGFKYDTSTSIQAVQFDRFLHEKSGRSLAFLNDTFGHLFTVKKLIPFAQLERRFTDVEGEPGDVAVSFILRSAFFNVSEWLHSRENPVMKMGPATLKILVNQEAKRPEKKRPSTSGVNRTPQRRVATAGGQKLVVLDVKTQKPVKEIDLDKLKKTPLQIQGVQITLKKSFSSAVVVENKLSESDNPESKNPALVLEVEFQGKKLREVVYAKFPGFSLHKEGIGGLTFTYTGALDTSDSPEPQVNPHQAMTGSSENSKNSEDTGRQVIGERGTGNEIEFHLNEKDPQKVRVELYKNQQLVGSEVLTEGQSFQTPWMGMKLSLGTIAWGKKSSINASPVEPQKGEDLPPSAVLISPQDEDKNLWIIEGDVQYATLNGRPAQIYFGRETLDLPFRIELEKFKKVDYPGTETPMSFESSVRIDGGKAEVISMNNPLKKDGYTIYQSSYVLNPGQPPESVFSINKDPGRAIKYWGSLILSLGIVIFTIMRSHWYRKRSAKGHATTMSLAMFFILFAGFSVPHKAFAQQSADAPPKSVDAEQAKSEFIRTAKLIDTSVIRRVAVQHNGRIKPLDTLSREIILFVTGSYSKWGLSAAQIYLATIVSPVAPFVELIEIRSPELRERLGALKTKRFFSLSDLTSSPLAGLAQPLIEKEQNKKKLDEKEKKITESFNQLQLFQFVQSGDHLFQSTDFSSLNDHSQGNSGNKEIQQSLTQYLRALSRGENEQALIQAKDLVNLSKSQKTPEIMNHSLEKIDTEVFYNDAHLFFWAYVLCLILGSLLLVPKLSNRFSNKWILFFYALPILTQVTGLGLRVFIMQFAPVTNMFGTMIWVSLGVNVFSAALYFLYGNRLVSGVMLIGSGLILLLTDNAPLILSPDMDPIVAVLRSNYWLSTHVTTITISYAAFTIAMILGNWALVRVWTHKDNTAFFKEYAHYAYRMIQLGVFLLTAGIILGGIWADESWGRFWGWDPKETWALIADLGFLVILHARYTGWVKDFELLALSPIAYLLVIMAWYGVNFILAAGLHSYGFSSGGATMVAVFVSAQLALLVASYFKIRMGLHAKNQS